MTNEQFVGMIRTAFEEMAKKQLKEKRVPISEENIENEVWKLVLYSASISVYYRENSKK